MCRDICKQPAHAEVNALRYAGSAAKGSVLYVDHYYACDNCKAEAALNGIQELKIGVPPFETE